MEQMDLFETFSQKELFQKAPLAVRMAPRSLEEFVGQEQIIGEGKLLRRAIEADQLASLIFWGPPGVGKTALAKVIAKKTKARFQKLSAVLAGLKELRYLIDEAEINMEKNLVRTILFIDEIHRFNKSQQDALLPAVEEGFIVLIGATTENPYFEVNSALLSRSRIFCLEPLRPEHLKKILRNALTDKERGFGKYRIEVEPRAIDHWVNIANGDARSALNALELAVLSTPEDEKGVKKITVKTAEESIQQRAVLYDREGEEHHSVISAFIKSLRGSDPDAALYWMARMIRAGEDPRFIARRMVILAAEDIGLADPRALLIANAAVQALEFVGMPEARLPLAEAAIYLSCAPKSNSVIKAMDAAMEDVKRKEIEPVPLHLRNPHVKGTKEMGYGEDYLYPHDFPSGTVDQDYLPKKLKGVKYYYPTSHGAEREIREWFLNNKKFREE